MRNFLLDPWLFNYIICTLYATNATQFELRAAQALVNGDKTAAWVLMWNGLYWMAALSITAVVTWGTLR